MKVQVLYFASAKEALEGLTGESYEASNLSELMSLIRKRHATRTNFQDILKTSMIALNDEYVYEMASVGLKEGDEVAVIPPISGG